MSKSAADRLSDPLTEAFVFSDREIFPIIMSHEDQVNKDYRDGFSDPRLTDDILKYLFHKSDLYFKAVLGKTAEDMYR